MATARMVFGSRHPAIAFLLLLASVDEGIGLAIVRLVYPDPRMPVDPAWLDLTGMGMFAAYSLHRLGVRSYWPAVLLGGPFLDRFSPGASPARAGPGLYCAFSFRGRAGA